MLLRPLSKVPPMITIGPKRIPIQGIIFDMDGTLTTPYLDFRKMRESIGMDPTSREDILVHLERLPGIKTWLFPHVEIFFYKCLSIRSRTGT